MGMSGVVLSRGMLVSGVDMGQGRCDMRALVPNCAGCDGFGCGVGGCADVCVAGVREYDAVVYVCLDHDGVWLAGVVVAWCVYVVGVGDGCAVCALCRTA